jgi:hypothetical protein
VIDFPKNFRGFGFSRQVARHATRSLGYDGAAGGRRGRNMGDIPLSIPAGLAARQPLAWRARYLAANNGHAAAGVGPWESGLVGGWYQAPIGAP